MRHAKIARDPNASLEVRLINPAVDVNPDPRSGRLMANIFVDFFPLAGRH